MITEQEITFSTVPLGTGNAIPRPTGSQKEGTPPVRHMFDDLDEWQPAIAALTDAERAPYADPQTYADTMAAYGTRL